MAKAKKSSTGAAAVGMGVAAAAVAAAGAYWLYGAKDAAKHRKIAHSWMLKARGEVLEAAEAVIAKAGEIDKEAYMQIVEGVLKRYSKVAGVTSAQMTQMTRDMKEAWLTMQKAHKSTPVKKAKKAVKKVASKK